MRSAHPSLRLFCLVLVLLGLLPLPGTGRAEAPVPVRSDGPVDAARLLEVEHRVAELLPKLSAATVGLGLPGSGAGSGVIVSADGLVLTAGHVSGAPGRKVRVLLADGREFTGNTLGRNGVEDYSMVRLENLPEGTTLPFVEVGRSSDLRTGQFVVALGHPGGFRRDRPPVLRVGRVIRQGLFVQTDAVLVGGDSGGPLFDLDGKVVGIHSRIGAAQSDNRHVPTDKFTAAWDRLLASEDWNPSGGVMNWARNRPWLGIEGEDDPAGVRVTAVDQSSPAGRAGIAPGDVIISFNDKDVQGLNALVVLIGQRKIGEEVTVSVVRESGDTQRLAVTLARRPAS